MAHVYVIGCGGIGGWIIMIIHGASCAELGLGVGLIGVVVGRGPPGPRIACVGVGIIMGYHMPYGFMPGGGLGALLADQLAFDDALEVSLKAAKEDGGLAAP